MCCRMMSEEPCLPCKTKAERLVKQHSVINEKCKTVVYAAGILLVLDHHFYLLLSPNSMPVSKTEMTIIVVNMFAF